MKGLLRNAKIEIVEERQVIVEEDQGLDYVVVLLEGKLGIKQSSFSPIINTTPTIDPSTLTYQNIFERLTFIAKKERDQLRKVTKLQRKGSLPVSQY